MFRRKRDKSPPKMEISGPTNFQQVSGSTNLNSLIGSSQSGTFPRPPPSRRPQRTTSLPSMEQPPLTSPTTGMPPNLPRSATESHFASVDPQKTENVPPSSAAAGSKKSHRKLLRKKSIREDIAQYFGNRRSRSPVKPKVPPSPSIYGDDNTSEYGQGSASAEPPMDFDAMQGQIDADSAFRVRGAATEPTVTTVTREMQNMVASPKVRRVLGQGTEADEQIHKLKQQAASKGAQAGGRARGRSGTYDKHQGDEVLEDFSGESPTLRPTAMPSTGAPVPATPTTEGQISIYRGTDRDLVGSPFSVQGHGLTGQSPTKSPTTESRLRSKSSKIFSGVRRLANMTPGTAKHGSLAEMYDLQGSQTASTSRRESAKSSPTKEAASQQPSAAFQPEESYQTRTESGPSKPRARAPTPPPKAGGFFDEEVAEIGVARAVSVTAFPPGSAKVVTIPPRAVKGKGKGKQRAAAEAPAQATNAGPEGVSGDFGGAAAMPRAVLNPLRQNPAATFAEPPARVVDSGWWREFQAAMAAGKPWNADPNLRE